MNMFKANTTKTPEEYIANISDESRRAEIQKLYEFINKVIPSHKPYMMNNFISWAQYHYKSKSGREGDWMTIALASQKEYISVYVCAYNDKGYIADNNKKELGKVSVGKSCIRFKKFADVDLPTLKRIIVDGVKMMQKS